MTEVTARELRLTERQKRLADRFMEHENAAKAAREAGHPPAIARQKANQVLRLPKVLAYLEENGYLQAAKELTPSHVEAMLVKHAVDGKSETTQMRATEGLARVKAMFVDRHEVTHELGPSAVLTAMVQNGRSKEEILEFCQRTGLHVPQDLNDPRTEAGQVIENDEISDT